MSSTASIILLLDLTKVISRPSGVKDGVNNCRTGKCPLSAKSAHDLGPYYSGYFSGYAGMLLAVVCAIEKCSGDWRIQPKGFFDSSNTLTAEVIQIEHRHRCAANRSVSLYFMAFDSEVFRPVLADGVKQRHLLSCQRINRCCPVGFMQIASGAC